MLIVRTILFCFILIFCLSTQAFTLQPSQWINNQVTLHVALNLNGNSTASSGVSWDQGFQQAAQQWQDRTNFSFNIINQTSDPCAGVDIPGQATPLIPEDDFRNGAGFNHNNCGSGYGASTLAVTTTYFRGTTTTESDISFNANQNWDIYSGPWLGNKADFRRVAAHELGHLIGLGHEDSAPSIMQSTLKFQSTLEVPTQDDINGINSRYGSKTLEPIVLKLEEPSVNEIKTGVANLRGWVVSLAGIERIELFIDEQFFSTIPAGAIRDDVADQFQNYPSSRNSGFSMAINYSNFTTGDHNAQIRVVDKQGRVQTVIHKFTVVRFDTPFIHQANQIDLSTAHVSFSSNSVTIDGLKAEGKTYKLTLEWQVATQSYEIVRIEPVLP